MEGNLPLPHSPPPQKKFIPKYLCCQTDMQIRHISFV